VNTAHLSPGHVFLGRYELLGFHAAGSMQNVYIAFDRALNRKVILKTPNGKVKDRRFKRGAEMGARVNHPNVAATFDYYEDNTITFLVEEIIAGTDLAQRLARDFLFLDPSLAAHVIHHIARALHEAHRVGICHRDLKPSNVMVSADNALASIKLTDFGIAKLAENELAAEIELFGTDESTLTTSNTLLGAIPYLAPECWDDWKAAGQAMDIWALGCIAYELLYGSPPFGAGKPAIAKVIRAQQLGKVSISQIPWFGKHPNTLQLETGLWTLIESCLAIQPAGRPSAADVVRTCDAFCYAASPRHTGIIAEFPKPTRSGSKGNYGDIRDDKSGTLKFFHGSDYFGSSVPTAGQRVCYCIYPGTPKPRLAPVLHLRAI
jgi:eukaryotic-like serine/threonine-protein kinase